MVVGRSAQEDLMLSAMIVVGSELDLWEQARDLDYYLHVTARIRNVTLCESWNRTPNALEKAFLCRATLAGRQPFLLAYIGHGYKNKRTGETGWSYGVKNADCDLILPYATLSDWLFKYRDGPTLLLNACCYAESFLTPTIRENPANRISLIAAAVSEGVSYGTLIPDIIGSWRDHRAYVPQTRDGTLHTKRVVETRFGPSLDHHFFPRP